MKICLVDIKKFIEKNRSYIIYQRILHLAQNYEIFLITKESPLLKKELRASSHFIFWRGENKNVYLDRFLFFSFALLKIIQVYRKHKFDIIYTGTNFSYFLGLIFKNIFSIKWIVDIEEHPEFQKRSWEAKGKFSLLRALYYKARIFLLKRTLKYADLVIAQGISNKEGLPKRLIGNFHVNQNKLLALPIGVDLTKTSSWNPGQQPQHNGFRVIYSGYLSRWRGIDNLLLSVAKLKDKIPNLKLILVGPYKDDDERQYLEKIVKDLCLDGDVDYKGYVPHEISLNLIQGSDICICPFPKNDVFEQAYSLKIPEYLAMGKAVIATNLECIREYIKNEENGLLINSNDPEELVSAIFRLYREENLKKKLERNARKSVLRYDWNKLHAKLDQKIRELI